jgi:hypothetical protein
MKKSLIYQAVLAAMLITSSAAVLAVDEVENNAPIQIAQPLTRGSDGSVTVNASVSSPGDVDYYSFHGTEGEKLNIDIDGGVQISPLGVMSGVDTTIALFGPGPAFLKLAENDDAAALDEGSAHVGDSLIPEFRLPATGVYTVGVSRRNGMFMNGGGFLAGRAPGLAVGTYTLAIGPLEPPVQLMNIDVKPGSPDPSPLNAKAKGVVPVALLGAKDFDVKEVDVASLKFGKTGDEATVKHCQKNFHDFNGDGYLDLVCHFDNGAAGFSELDTMGTVKGMKAGKKAFRGHGRIKVTPAERGE